MKLDHACVTSSAAQHCDSFTCRARSACSRRFIKLNHSVAKAVHPFVGQTADRNFADTLSFVSNFSYTAENRPEAIEQIAVDAKDLDQTRRTHLVKLAYECEAAGKQWKLSRGQTSSGEVTTR